MSNLPKKKQDKLKLTKLDLDFCEKYIELNYNKVNTIKALGMDKKNGREISERSMIKRADKLLSYPSIRAQINYLQKKALEARCFSLEKSLQEVYDDYLMLKERKSFHEANIAHQMFLNMTGYGKSNTPIIQQQIVSASDKPVQIVYNIPETKKNDDMNENL